MTDIVERLRQVTGFIRFETEDRVAAAACLSEEAADEIERLRGELDKAEAKQAAAWGLLDQVIEEDDEANSPFAASEALEECAKAILALKRCPHPNKQASTCGFESCPDCGARLEED